MWRRTAVPAIVVGVTLVAALLRVLVTPSFYFADDTQLGALGQWYALGDHLLSGSLPILEPSAWQGGNYLSEGQWGIINPVTWLVGIGARLSPDVLVFATVVKLVFLAVMAIGTYLLAREFGADPYWAGVSGVLAPLGGFTVYMDAPSWVTGLMTTAFLPWAWWGLKRLQNGRSPLGFFVASYLLVTVGYVYGTIVLALVLIVEGAIAASARRWRVLLVVAGAAVWAGLWAVVIYLPGVLTAPVTKRGEFAVAFAGFLSADIADYGAVATPSATASVLAWFGPTTQAPLMYVAWILPLVILFAPFARRRWKGLLPVVTIGIVLFAVTLGPSDVGPLRWPLRFMPYLTVAAVLIVAVLASRRSLRRIDLRRVAIAAVAVAGFAYLAWMVSPASGRSILVSTAVQLAGLVAVAVVSVSRRKLARAGSRVAVFTIMLATTVALVAVQIRVFPVSPLHTYAVPSAADDLERVLDDTSGDVMTVGDALVGRFDPSSFRERLIANLWYFSPASVMNVYTVIPFSAFADDLCIEIRGRTCDQTMDRLFSTDESSGASVVDLLAVSEIVGYRMTYPEPPSPLPDGWRLVDSDTLTWRIARTTPLDSAGGVVWAGDGTRVAVTDVSDTSVSFRVDAVGADPRVTMSRLAWPGYTVEGARMAKPLRDYLLTVDVSGAEPGSTVTVAFNPPGAPWMVASALGATLLLIVWVLLRRRRRHPHDRAANPGHAGVV